MAHTAELAIGEIGDARMALDGVAAMNGEAERLRRAARERETRLYREIAMKVAPADTIEALASLPLNVVDDVLEEIRRAVRLGPLPDGTDAWEMLA